MILEFSALNAFFDSNKEEIAYYTHVWIIMLVCGLSPTFYSYFTPFSGTVVDSGYLNTRVVPIVEGAVLGDCVHTTSTEVCSGAGIDSVILEDMLASIVVDDRIPDDEDKLSTQRRILEGPLFKSWQEIKRNNCRIIRGSTFAHDDPFIKYSMPVCLS